MLCRNEDCKPKVVRNPCIEVVTSRNELSTKLGFIDVVGNTLKSTVPCLYLFLCQPPYTHIHLITTTTNCQHIYLQLSLEAQLNG